jgi:hypothetical protein
MRIIKRLIQKPIEDKLFKKKIIIIYGARQVGKTTLIKEIQKKHPDSVYFNCDEPDIRAIFSNTTSTKIKSFIGDKKLVFLDEAQRVENIGLTLKLAIDNFSEMQIVATGSSSFDLSNKISEPLTGRKYEFTIYPFSIEELKSIYPSEVEINRVLEQRILFGMYPEILDKSQAEQTSLLKNMAKSYLYKDIFNYQGIQSPELLEKILQALALQIGNEVSYNELAATVGADKKTIESYIQILEKAFIIFRLNPFSRNLRKELKKLRKIYFYDTGIRNTLINNFNPLNMRQDTGALWENFVISERIKFNNNHGLDPNKYFWRTHDQKEIDYIEEANGELSAFEFKWRSDKIKFPKDFAGAYPNSKFEVITQNNYWEFLQ